LLESALSEPDSYVRRVAAVKLRGVLESTIEELSRVRAHGTADERMAAVDVLGTLGEVGLVDAGAGFLLATCAEYPFSLDHLGSRRVGMEKQI
jgi:hypothetical protein